MKISRVVMMLMVLVLICAGCITPPAPEPVMTSNEFLVIIGQVSILRTVNTPDRVDVTLNFDGGQFIIFQVRNRDDVWLGGQLKNDEGQVLGFNANVQLRHRIMTVLGEANARDLGAHQLRLGLPEMPILTSYDDTYYWQTDNGKSIYEIDNVSVYQIRVVNKLKEELGITGNIINVNGTILKYR